MRGIRAPGAYVAGAAAIGIAVAFAAWSWQGNGAKTPLHSAAPSHPAPAVSHAAVAPKPTPTRTKGVVRLTGQVPQTVSNHVATIVRAHPAAAQIRLSFGLPMRNRGSLDALIAQEGRTHHYLTRAQLYQRFSPSQQQVSALESWLTAHGFRIAHVGSDRLAVSASASTATIEQALHVKINDYLRPATNFRGLTVAPFQFYANTVAPAIPARLGVQTISGLSDVDRFYTTAQLATRSTGATRGTLAATTRSGGYFPSDLRAMYDVAGHGFDGTGQTIGFVLWGAGVYQPAATSFATATGDQLITVDTPCSPTGNSPTVPSTCTTVHVAGDHLLNVLENGNANNNFAANDETALDIEQAHGMATHAGLKYYLADCTSAPPAGSGLTNASCNGTDVGMEEAIEDAANDPTLHVVSDSWAFGGEAEWGNADPFLIASENSFALAAAAGTTFYFSTGDSGTYQSGYPSDSQYVIAVGGTSMFSTTSPNVLSTEDTWAAAGSWCSNIEPRPSWQTGAGVAANAPCLGRSIPDISAIADTNTSIAVRYSSSATGVSSGAFGGTSVAAPEIAGMEAVTENFIAAQTYPGATPPIGFTGPVMYQLGNSGHSDSYFRDVYCGNTASPSGGPDGDAAQPGWDAATGWGSPDWFNYSTGYALALGATNLSVPASLSHNYRWTCAKTPSNSSERGISCASASVCFAVGAASGTTPWYAKFLASGSWGAVNTFFKTLDGGQTWVPSNSDMISINCTSSSQCVEVGDGGRIRTTSDSGTTWSDVASPFNKALTQVRCPSASTCYAIGDRGTALKSTDGGASWAYLPSIDGNPLYGLDCPSESVCYATDIYAHIIKTSDGGASWTWQSTPVTTPGLAVPGSGGPNPFAGLFGISCPSTSTCVAVGGFPPVGTDPPIVTTTDGGATWTLRTSNSGSGNYLNAVTCVSTTQCWAVGRGGSIVTTSNLTTWTKVTSGTTNMLGGITCVGASFCLATGQNGTVDTFNGSTWTVRTGLGGSVFLAGVSCASSTACYAAGKQGVTLATTDGGATWTQQAGGGTTQQMNAVSCPAEATCYAVGNAGTILQTKNGGQSWLPATSGTTSALNGVSCSSPTACVAVGAAGVSTATTDGSTWATHSTATTSALAGVSCGDSTCVAVGAAGTVRTTADTGQTWATSTSGTTTALNAVNCPSDTCYAAGASGVLLGSADGGVTWTAQTSNTTQALSGVACVDDRDCFAGGASGTVVATFDGGTAWTQQGNPLSGPTTALNGGPTSIIAINGTGCNAVRCFMATASSGDIMATPLLTVAVNTTSAYGTTPNLAGLAPSDPAIAYSPASQAGNVTGSLTCTTTADATSDVGLYPISGCSGLDDAGFNLIYDYASSSHTVVQAAQTITMAALADKTWGDPDFDLSATSTSGGTVTFAVSGNCTITGVTVHVTSAGSCTVTASQAGSTDYAAAPDVVQTFAIDKADQTISFGSIGDQTFGAADFEIDSTATSGLAVSLAVTSGPCVLDSATAPAELHIAGAGSCTVTASQAGDGNYNAAPDEVRTFSIAKADQTITFGALAGTTFGDPDFTVSATASSGLAVTFVAAGNCTMTGSTVHITDAGTCTVTASQAGDDNYNPAADVPQTFAIAKASQTITFGPLPGKTFGSPDFTVSATASSGLAVTFTAAGTCTITGATVHITTVGSCTITASQPGNGDYNAATSVSQTFVIANSTSGQIVGLGLELLTGASADVLVDATGSGPRGSVTYTAPSPRGFFFHRPPPYHFESVRLTAIGIASDSNSAWLSGVGRDGKTFLLYVEDNSSRRARRSSDIFQLWINGVLQTGTGALRRGDITINVPGHGHGH